MFLFSPSSAVRLASHCRRAAVGLSVATVALLSLLAAPAAAQTTLNFVFDHADDGINSAVLGSGSVTFATDPGDGLFTAVELGGVTYSFTFGDITFTDADLASDPAQTRFLLSSYGNGGRRLQFSDDDGDAGGFGGSLDFLTSAGDVLSFEPSRERGSLSLYVFGGIDTGNLRQGTYFGSNGVAFAAAAPEPGSLALVLPLLVGVAARRRRSK